LSQKTLEKNKNPKVSGPKIWIQKYLDKKLWVQKDFCSKSFGFKEKF